MVMSKGEFIDLYNATNIRITGRSASSATLDKHYKYFLEAVDLTESENGYPVFEKDGGGNEIDRNGNLSWKFQPVYDMNGPKF
jgi:hypothetical protein